MNSNTKRTPLINDYGPAIRAARMASAQDRQDARLVRRTNFAIGTLAALAATTFLILQVLPAMGTI